MTSQGMFITKYIVTVRIEQNWIQKHLLYILVYILVCLSNKIHINIYLTYTRVGLKTS